MKWINKGKQYADLLKHFSKRKRILIYGAGNYGAKFLEEIINPYLRQCIDGYIDRDIEKQKSGYKGYKVYSPNILYMEHDENHLIVVAVHDAEGKAIAKRLEKAGYVKEWDYFMYDSLAFQGSLNDVFMPVFVLASLDKIYVTSGCIVPDTNCNLHCRDCLNFNPYIKKHIRRNIEELKKDMDLYFRWVDFSERYQISGGEPLLYPDIEELILYIGENYRSKVGIFEIVLNGTIIPTDKICVIMKKYDITVYLDNYVSTISEELNHRKEIIEQFNKYGVKWIDNTVKQWFALDIENTDNSEMTSEELMAYFDNCNNPWHSFEYGKLYSCNFSRFAMKAGIIDEKENDYFDLNKMTDEKKTELIEFMLGYTTKGYVDFCKRCAGWGPSNKNIVPVAIQIER